MKNWISKNYKTIIITAFLIPIITVAVVSISHVTQWYGISNPITWAIYLSVGIEIAALSALAAISVDMGRKVYFPFIIVTLIQFIGNIFFSYSFIDISGQSFKNWVELVSPLLEFMGVEPTDFIGHKRFLALFAGGMLPIISLSFLHMLVKYTEDERKKNEKIIEDEYKHMIDDGILEKEIKKHDEEHQKVDANDLMSEVSRVRLTHDELEKLEKILLKKHNHVEPEIEINIDDDEINDEIVDQYYKEYSDDEIKKEEESYDFENEEKETLSQPDIVEKEEHEIPMNIDIEEEVIPYDEAIDNEPVMENILPVTENSIDDFDGFVPEPFATPEEVEKYNLDNIPPDQPEEEKKKLIEENQYEEPHQSNTVDIQSSPSVQPQDLIIDVTPVISIEVVNTPPPKVVVDVTPEGTHFVTDVIVTPTPTPLPKKIFLRNVGNRKRTNFR